MESNDKKIWTIKGASLSDKSAREEYGISQNEIIAAIKNGELQYRINYIYENPYYKLIRSEIENLIEELHGKNYLKTSKLKNELKQIESELRKLKAQTKILNEKKEELQLLLSKQDIKKG